MYLQVHSLILHSLMKQIGLAAPHCTTTNIYYTHAQCPGNKDLKLRQHPRAAGTQPSQGKSIIDIDAN